MRCIIHPRPGVVQLGVRADPVARGPQILVSVTAAGLNRADLLQRAGKYPAPAGWPPDIPGLEYAGTVRAVGDQVSRFRPGDRVMGLAGGGAQAELLVVDEREALAIPDGLDTVAAGAVPEAFFTAWDALALRARAAPGERMLIHAAGSGVGTAAVQLGRTMELTVIGTSRTSSKLERAAPLGMSIGVLTSDADWPSKVGGPVDVILDTLGGAYFSDNLALLAAKGRIVVLSTMTGARVADVDLGLVLRRRLEVIGTAMRVRTLEERSELVDRFAREVAPLLASGALSPVIDSVMPMTDIVRAHERLQGNETFGKIVLVW